MFTGVRQAVSSLRRSPLSSAMAIILLALTIAATTVVLALRSTFAARNLPVEEPGRFFEIFGSQSTSCGQRCLDLLKPETLRELGSLSRTVSGVVSMRDREYSLGSQSNREFVAVAAVSGNFFETLGVPPAVGRLLRQNDDAVGAPPAAVLSYAFWRSHFSGRRSITGDTIALGSGSVVVVGVAPRGFAYPSEKAAWISLSTDSALSTSSLLAVQGIAKLRVGSSFEQARAEWSVLVQHLAQRGGGADSAVALISLAEGRSVMSQRAVTLIASTLGVGLLAVINVEGLLLLQVLRRRRELSIRVALGAGKGALLKLAAAEVAVLTGLATLLAGVMLVVVLPWVRYSLGGDFPALFEVVFDGQTALLLLSVAMLLGATLILGYQWATGSIDARQSQGARQVIDSSAKGSHLRQVLITVQIALVVLMGATTASLSLSLWKADNVNLGYDADGATVASLDLTQTPYDGEPQAQELVNRLLRRLRETTGARNVMAWRSTFSGRWGGYRGASVILEDGRTIAGEGGCRSARCATPYASFDVTPAYFSTLAIPMLVGRSFSEADGTGSEPVAIINDLAAARWWPGENPVGKRFHLGSSESGGPWLTVVGVVKLSLPPDNMALRLAMAEATGYPILFRPLAQTHFDSRADLQSWMWGRKLWIGISAPVEEHRRHVSTIRALVAEEAKGAVLSDVGTLRAAVISSTGMAQVRSDAVIGGILCSIAALVALGGLATAVSEDVRRSAKAIGIRMALGASPARVIRETLHRGLRVVGLGIGAGALLCLLTNRVVQTLFWQGDGFVRGQLFSVGLARELFAPGVIGPLALLLFCAGALAALVPASGAASKDPQCLLQEE